jgi:hypothetical protein
MASDGRCRMRGNCENDAPIGGGEWGRAPRSGAYTLRNGFRVYCERAGGRVWTKISAWTTALPLNPAAINVNGCATSGTSNCKHADEDINLMARGDRVYRIRIHESGFNDKTYLYTPYPYVDRANSFGMRASSSNSRGITASRYPGNNFGSWGRFNYNWVDFLHIRGHSRGQSCQRYFIGHNNNPNDDCYTGASGAVRCINGGGSCGNHRLLRGVSVWIIDV